MDSNNFLFHKLLYIVAIVVKEFQIAIIFTFKSILC